MQLGCLEDSRDGFEFASKVLYHISRFYSPPPQFMSYIFGLCCFKGFFTQSSIKGNVKHETAIIKFGFFKHGDALNLSGWLAITDKLDESAGKAHLSYFFPLLFP